MVKNKNLAIANRSRVSCAQYAEGIGINEGRKGKVD